MKTTLAVGVAFAVSRIWLGFNCEPEPFHWTQAYKDAAHLFVGGLAVAWFKDRQQWQWFLFWVLNVVEIAVAVYSRSSS